MATQKSARLGIGQTILIAVISVYRWTFGFILGGECRFYPSCSTYGLQAVRRHGAVHGASLTARRLLRCHPFHPGGYDPVPGVEETP